MIDEKLFRDRSNVVYLSYAPAGFGHLRVADALYHGLPDYVTPILLGTSDTSVTFLHRLTSVHPLFRALFVWGQSSWREKFFTILYRRFLHSTAKNIKVQLEETISERIDPVSTIVIVATHFGIAHQVSFIKKELEKELSVKVILIVQVTDDSPQLIWYVHHADIIFVPSERTKDVFEKYDTRRKLEKPRLEVVAYPVSPNLGIKLSDGEYEKRLAQLSPQREREVHMIVPLSGAAVGTKNLEELIDALHKYNSRFLFHIVVKDAPYTLLFIDRLSKHKEHIKIYSSKNDKAVVNLYEEVYMNEVIALEITKPSEQAFKALYYPKQRGGSILLFAAPVGRQEFDNLDFLTRHKLIPTQTEHVALWELAKQKEFDREGTMYKAIIANCSNWRGIILPSDPASAAEFIAWGLEHGVFHQMGKHEKHIDRSQFDSEILSNGVETFWEEVSKYTKEHLLKEAESK